MNLTELSARLDDARSVLRVEARERYESDSDQDWVRRFLAGEPQPDVELKRPWLDRLTAAARAGTPWRRLRVIPDPLTDYVRYQCSWSYPDNAAAGEAVRAIDRAEWERLAGGPAPDFYLLDGRVIVMTYDSTGRFTDAAEITDPTTVATLRSAAETAWDAHSRPMDDWWTDHRVPRRSPSGS